MGGGGVPEQHTVRDTRLECQRFSLFMQSLMNVKCVKTQKMFMQLKQFSLLLFSDRVYCAAGNDYIINPVVDTIMLCNELIIQRKVFYVIALCNPLLFPPMPSSVPSTHKYVCNRTYVIQN